MYAMTSCFPFLSRQNGSRSRLGIESATGFSIKQEWNRDTHRERLSNTVRLNYLSTTQGLPLLLPYPYSPPPPSLSFVVAVRQKHENIQFGYFCYLYLRLPHSLPSPPLPIPSLLPSFLNSTSSPHTLPPLTFSIPLSIHPSNPIQSNPPPRAQRATGVWGLSPHKNLKKS